MPNFTIEIEEINVEFIQCLSKVLDCSCEQLLEDIVFNQLENLRKEINKICVVEE